MVRLPVLGLFPIVFCIGVGIRDARSAAGTSYVFAIWLLATSALLIVVWSWTWRPRIVATPQGVVIRNPRKVRRLAWDEIDDITVRANGDLTFRSTDGTVISAVALRIPPNNKGETGGLGRSRDAVRTLQGSRPWRRLL